MDAKALGGHRPRRVLGGCQTPNTAPDALASCRARGGEVEEVCTVRRIVFDCVAWGYSCRGAALDHDSWCALPEERQSIGWIQRDQFCNQPH